MKQIREIKAGGGFLSFDVLYAHFGLGEETMVNKLTVVWSTGERTIFSRKFEAGYKYAIIRASIVDIQIK